MNIENYDVSYYEHSFKLFLIYISRESRRYSIKCRRFIFRFYEVERRINYSCDEPDKSQNLKSETFSRGKPSLPRLTKP